MILETIVITAVYTVMLGLAVYLWLYGHEHYRPMFLQSPFNPLWDLWSKRRPRFTFPPIYDHGTPDHAYDDYPDYFMRGTSPV